MFRPYQQTFRVCYQVALIDHRLVLGLVGLVGRILRVEKLLLVAVEQLLLVVVEQLLLVVLKQLLLVVVKQLLLAVVDQLLNPILLSNRDVKRSLTEVEVTCMLSHTRILQFSIWQLLEYNRLEVFLEG